MFFLMWVDLWKLGFCEFESYLDDVVVVVLSLNCDW